MRPSAVTAVASIVSSAAPDSARCPRWMTCQSVMQPSSAEYWHIGAMTMRLARLSPATWRGLNNADMGFLAGEDAGWLASGFHQELVGSEARLVIEDLRSDHQLIGLRAVDELPKLVAGRFGTSDGGYRKNGTQQGAGVQWKLIRKTAFRWWQLDRTTRAKRNERLLNRSGEQFRLLIAVGDDRVEAKHHIGLVELSRQLERLAIDGDRFHHHLRRE